MKKEKKNRKRLSRRGKILLWSAVGLLLLALVIWTVWQNNSVGLTEFTLTEENLPYAFDGFRIAQVSDLHNSGLWEKTIARLREAEPDLIVITGDLVDCSHPDVELALEFIQEAVRIADCFYVSGNHEHNLPEETYAQLVAGMEAFGVMVLEDSRIKIHLDGDYITLAGHGWGDTDQLGNLRPDEGYCILLSHQPEGFEDYAAAGFDLVFSGHAHGGQIRVPLIGAVYAPGQGLFPKYDSGLYSEGCTDMVVSRGIGNSVLPFRFNNQPEVVVVALKCA